MLDADPPLPPDKLETRRTGPELRAAIREQLEIYAIANPSAEFEQLFLRIDVLLDEMRRRSPKWEVSRRRQPDPDPETILAIRQFKTENPGAHSRDMSIRFNTSTRCISFALVGKRDGSPVFDKSGKRIRAARIRKNGSAPDEPIPESEPWDVE